VTPRFLFVLLLTSAAAAQPVQLRVYSEFQRVDPFGQVLAADRAETPREILSPAVARSAFTSFHVAVTGPARANYFLAVQSNPPNAFQWTIQEEKFIRSGEVWIPDKLEDVKPPYFGVIPDPKANIPGQTTRVYLVDVWIPQSTPPGTVRFEILVKAGYWVLWPMEVRVLNVVVPDRKSAARPSILPEPDLPADTVAWTAIEAYMSGAPVEVTSTTNVRSIIQRNAVQDMTLARQLEGGIHREQIVQEIARLMNQSRRTSAAEWYLKVRDYLYRVASKLAQP
jgi:hypothetical protein